MAFWKQNVDQIITSNGFPLLTHLGTISHAQMESATSALYADYDQRRKTIEALEADAQLYAASTVAQIRSRAN